MAAMAEIVGERLLKGRPVYSAIGAETAGEVLSRESNSKDEKKGG